MPKIPPIRNVWSIFKVRVADTWEKKILGEFLLRQGLRIFFVKVKLSFRNVPRRRQNFKIDFSHIMRMFALDISVIFLPIRRIPKKKNQN